MTDISVIGAGYVGLTTATGMVELGHQVVVADVLPERVASLNRGELPIVEAGMQERLRAVYRIFTRKASQAKIFFWYSC